MATVAGDRVNATVVIGDQTRRSQSSRFAGGRLVLVAGDIKLDLWEAQPVPEGARIRVFVLFGDVEILVPRGWVTEIGATGLLTDVKDQTSTGGPGDVAAPPRLIIGGFTLVGDITVRHAE